MASLISEHPEFRGILFAGGSNGTMLGEVSPINMNFAKYIRDIGYLTFDLNLSHPLAKRRFIEPYATDIVLMHKDHHIWGGIITGVHVNSQNRWLEISSREFGHYLEKRIWPIVDPFNPEIYSAIQKDSFTVVTEILDRTLMESHSLMMDYSLGLSGIKINYRIEPGDTESIYEKIKDLSEQNPGFDFTIHVSIVDQMIHLELMAQSPRIERQNDYVFEHGKNIRFTAYDCTGAKATSVVGNGAGSSSKTTKIASEVDQMQAYRRLESVVELGDIIDPNIIQRQTEAELMRLIHSHREDFRGVYIPEPNVDLWAEVEVGDICRVKIDTEYESINEDFRVVGYEVSPSSQGDEEVVVIFEDAKV